MEREERECDAEWAETGGVGPVIVVFIAMRRGGRGGGAGSGAPWLAACTRLRPKSNVSSWKDCRAHQDVPRLEGRLLCLLKPLPQLAASMPSPSPSFSSTTSFVTFLPLALLTSPGSGNVLDNDPLRKRLTPLTPLPVLADVLAADDGTPWNADEAAELAEMDADGWWRGLETVFARRSESVSGAGGPATAAVPELPAGLDDGGEAACEKEFVDGPRG